MAVKPKGKLMQLATRELTVSHCKISDVALLVEPTGHWQLSLRGDQNYLQAGQQNPRNSKLDIKRNAFNVHVRLLSTSRGQSRENLTPVPTAEPNFTVAGSLAICEIKIPEFWVQREAPQYIVRRGHSPLIQKYFDQIEQAEFEFFIRLDPLSSGKGVVPLGQTSP